MIEASPDTVLAAAVQAIYDSLHWKLDAKAAKAVILGSQAKLWRIDHGGTDLGVRVAANSWRSASG